VHPNIEATPCANTFQTLGNIVIIAIIAAGGFAYVRYQQQQGRPVKIGNTAMPAKN
jgi:hypothetical protein